MPELLDPIYLVDDAAILGPTEPILRELEIALPDRMITVLLGPSGGGKSVLLHALSGRRMPGELRLDGRWRFRGVSRARWTPADIFLLPQRRAGAAGGTWRDALASDAPVVLMDEPCASLTSDELAELSRQLLEQRHRRTIVIATHNIAFAKTIADYVLLLCGGVIDCAAPSARFFVSPPTPMAARIIEQGNCWPRAQLPSHFKWVSPSLAGMARPGLGRDRDIDRDLEAVAQSGIGLVVSLTEAGLHSEAVTRHGMDHIHFPVPDMGVPALAAAEALCERVAEWLADDRGGVVYHCHAGLGRTGTMLAVQLVHAGMTARDAIRAVRSAIRNAIQTAEQEQFVANYEIAREARQS